MISATVQCDGGEEGEAKRKPRAALFHSIGSIGNL